MNQTCADSVERSRAYYEVKFLQFHENKEEAIEHAKWLYAPKILGLHFAACINNYARQNI